MGKRAEAQMRVVVNKVYKDSNNGVGGRADALGCVPPVIGENWDPQGSTLN
jgi:hypothetical protein